MIKDFILMNRNWTRNSGSANLLYQTSQRQASGIFSSSVIKKFFIFMIIFLFIAQSVFALGVAPARKSFNFEPGIGKSGSFAITNPGGEAVDIVVAVQGELKDNVVIAESSFTIPANGEKDVNYNFNLPDELTPGVHSAEIVILQLPKTDELGETYIGAALAIITQLDVYVSYPGKYAEGSLTVIPTKDYKVDFKLIVENKGSFDLTSVRANLNVFTSLNEQVASLQTDDVSIASRTSKELSVVWDSKKAQLGPYRVVAAGFYDGKTFTVEKEFNLGEEKLSLEDIRIDNFKLGEIARIDMNIKNDWSEPVNGAFAELFIYNEPGELLAQEKSATEDIGSLETSVMSVYWDSKGARIGMYPSTLILKHSNGAEAPRKLEMVVISDSEAKFVGYGFVIDKSSTGSTTVYILISVIIVLILVNISWFIFLRKRFLKRK